MTLKDKLQAALKRQQEIVDTAKNGNRDLNDSETREFDTLQSSIDEIKGQISAEEKGAGDDDAVQRGITAERQRVSEITSLCREFGIDDATYIKDGISVDKTRAAVLDELKKKSGPLNIRLVPNDGDPFRAAAADALLMRAGVSVDKPTEGANGIRGMSLRDIAIECMVREGRSANELLRMDKNELYGELSRQFYNPSAAFPAILDAAIKKNIVTAYNSVPTTFEAWTSKGSVTDFKTTPDHSYLIGGAGDFLLVPENGEIKHDTPRTELLPQRKIDTYGRQFSMSRQAFINDDIGFLTNMPSLYAASAKKTINKQVYKILVNNPAIYDGANLFATAHKNIIGTGAAPSSATIQAIILQMQKQLDPFGDAIIIKPTYLVVPVGYGFVISTILRSPTINTADNTQSVNPLYGAAIQVIEDPTINALAGTSAAPWFMVGDKTSAKSIQVDYLNGQETPTIRRSEQAGQLGFVWDIFLDWGVTVVDYRGIAKNPGVVIS
ncbi:MAG: hypothetical protein CVU91_07385 [Firmicutes bacterium HGW-Firmicutes-16]|nr:MAG: hypothetical protein CVU91_07385 [Firmicutes bacterium HGW-Firmicutes-16]